MFCAMLGTVAGNLALMLGARGGIYVAGGIVPKLEQIPAPDWPCAAGALEDHHLCGRASPQWHESAVHC